MTKSSSTVDILGIDIETYKERNQLVYYGN